MALLTSEKILKMIPSLFETDLNSERHLFKNFEKVLLFDEGYIFYANPESLQLKYSYKKHANYEVDSTFDITGELKKFIFSKESTILDETAPLIKTIGLNGTSQKSYIVSKIFIKSLSKVIESVRIITVLSSFLNRKALPSIDVPSSLSPSNTPSYKVPEIFAPCDQIDDLNFFSSTFSLYSFCTSEIALS